MLEWMSRTTSEYRMGHYEGRRGDRDEIKRDRGLEKEREGDRERERERGGLEGCERVKVGPCSLRGGYQVEERWEENAAEENTSHAHLQYNTNTPAITLTSHVIMLVCHVTTIMLGWYQHISVLTDIKYKLFDISFYWTGHEVSSPLQTRLLPPTLSLSPSWTELLGRLVYLPSSLICDGERERVWERGVESRGGAYPMACSIRTYINEDCNSQLAPEWWKQGVL